MISDAELVSRCRAGDQNAWRELVERYSRYVYAITRTFGLADHDAEDVFQDVFARAFQRLESLRDPDSLRPWLAQLTRRRAIDQLRAGGREQATDDLEPEAVDERIDELTESLALRDALATLSEDCREILDRFFARDESYRTIADELELPSGTIASRISRCLARLRSAWEETAPAPRLEKR